MKEVRSKGGGVYQRTELRMMGPQALEGVLVPVYSVALTLLGMVRYPSSFTKIRRNPYRRSIVLWGERV